MSITVIERTDLHEQVRDGAALLDERAPDWRDQVDPDRLDMQNACDCVLGQVFGNFYRAIESDLKISYLQAYRLGFECEGPDYGPLTEAWREELDR
jgi:fumarate hydratase class II